MNSSTAALNLSLSLNDFKNREVILPSLTFTAIANAVVLNNAKPVFVDVEPSTLCIDVEHIRKAITKNTKSVKFFKNNNFKLIQHTYELVLS